MRFVSYFVDALVKALEAAAKPCIWIAMLFANVVENSLRRQQTPQGAAAGAARQARQEQASLDESIEGMEVAAAFRRCAKHASRCLPMPAEALEVLPADCRRYLEVADFVDLSKIAATKTSYLAQSITRGEVGARLAAMPAAPRSQDPGTEVCRRILARRAATAAREATLNDLRAYAR